MIATKKWDLGTFGGQITPKSDFSCLAGLSQQQQVGISLFSNNHMHKQFNFTVPLKRKTFILGIWLLPKNEI